MTATEAIAKEEPVAPILTELVDFIVAENPERFANFQTTPKVRERVWELIRREKNEGLAPKEKAELDTYGHLEHILRLAKAQARLNTATTDLLLQLADAMQNPSDGVALSLRAADRVFRLLSDTLPHLPRNGDLYPDGDGGLRVEWEHKTRQIRLIIHASEEREDYLYWQEGRSRSLETPVTPALLIEWQEWLRAAPQ